MNIYLYSIYFVLGISNLQVNKVQEAGGCAVFYANTLHSFIRDVNILGFWYPRTNLWIPRDDCMYINVGIDIHVYNTFRICVLFIKQLGSI